MKIEEGQTYKTRGGRITGPVRKSPEGSTHEFWAKDVGAWHENGMINIHYPHPYDIVEHIGPLREPVKVRTGFPTTPLKPLSTHPDNARTIPVYVAPGYDSLFITLAKALEQAQVGKGKERRAQPGVTFEDQPIIQIGRMVGMGFQNGQAIKKMIEAQGMLSRGEFAAAEREVLGAINYLAAVVIEINKRSVDAQTEAGE